MISDKSPESLISPCCFIHIVAFNTKILNRRISPATRSVRPRGVVAPWIDLRISDFPDSSFPFPVSIAVVGVDPGGKYRAGWQRSMAAPTLTSGLVYRLG